MNRTVTQQETDELFKACKNYGVFFYDVQIEIVDHLASMIEKQWNENPELEFEQAKKQAILSFGKSNFTAFARTMEKEVNRKYNRLHWQYFIHFYKWPKLLLTLALTLGLYTLFEISGRTETIVLCYSGLVLIGFLFYLIFISRKFRFSGKHGKTFLLESRQSINYSIIIFLIQLPNLTRIVIDSLNLEFTENKFIHAGLSFFMVLLSILLYAHMFPLARKIKEHITEQFPEFVK